jgi:hypothetical protein
MMARKEIMSFGILLALLALGAGVLGHESGPQKRLPVIFMAGLAGDGIKTQKLPVAKYLSRKRAEEITR